MKWAVRFSEAIENIRSGATRGVTLAACFVIVVAAAVSGDANAVAGITREAEGFQQSGGSTLVFSAPGSVDGQLCEGLRGLPNVRAAGALRRTEDYFLASAPQEKIPGHEATPGFVGVLRVSPESAPGLLMSAEVAQVAGVASGDRLRLADGTGPVVSAVYTYPDDGRLRGLDYAMISISTPDGAFDSCWVDEWPQTPELSRALRSVLLPGALADTNAEAKTTQLNPSRGSRFNAQAAFGQRLTRWSVAAAFLVAWTLSFSGLRWRKLELSSSLHAGLATRDLVSISLLEAAMWAIPGICAGAAIAACAAHNSDLSDRGVMWLLSGVTTCAAALGVVCGTVTAGLTIQEKHLLQHFKNR